MRISTYYLFTWVGLLVGAFSLSVTSHVVPVWIGILSFLLSIGTFTQHRLTGLSLSLPLWLYAIVVWTFAALTYSGHKDIFMIVGEFLSGILPLFLSRKHQTFGHWIGLMTVALLSLVGVIGTSGLSEYVLLIILLLFLVLNLNAANLLHLAGPTAATQQRLPKYYFKQFVPAFSVGIAFGVVIFYFFPRTARLWNPFNLRSRGATVTSYTGTVSLKPTQNIEESAHMSMQVESTDVKWLSEEGPELYFRGNTVDFFDGTNWSQSSRPTWRYFHDADLRYTLSSKLPARHLKIYRELNGTQAILYPQVLMSITLPVNMMGDVSFDSTATLLRGTREEMQYNYEVVVSNPTLDDEARVVPIKEFLPKIGHEEREFRMASNILQGNLPILLTVPNTVKKESYFTNWIQEIGGDVPNMTLYKLFLTLDEHFREKFKLTLKRNQKDGNAFKSFISEERAGHSEFFATAAAMYFRYFGIPARLVLGYRGGTFNQVSRVLEVRELNSHAWVEVYFPNSGWITYDPTPLLKEKKEMKWSFYASVYFNAAKFWFNRYVVNYNQQSQRDFMRTLAALGANGEGFSLGINLNRRNLQLILVIITLVTYLIWVKNRKRISLEKALALPDYYLLFVKKLRRMGVHREEAETYRHFHRRLQGLVKGVFVKQLGDAIERDLYSSDKNVEKRGKELKSQVSSWKPPKRR